MLHAKLVGSSKLERIWTGCQKHRIKALNAPYSEINGCCSTTSFMPLRYSMNIRDTAKQLDSSFDQNIFIGHTILLAHLVSLVH
jgi:hypothetical protein